MRKTTSVALLVKLYKQEHWSMAEFNLYSKPHSYQERAGTHVQFFSTPCFLLEKQKLSSDVGIKYIKTINRITQGKLESGNMELINTGITGERICDLSYKSKSSFQPWYLILIIWWPPIMQTAASPHLYRGSIQHNVMYHRFSNFKLHINLLRVLLNWRFWFTGLGWGLRFYISNSSQVMHMLPVCGPHFDFKTSTVIYGTNQKVLGPIPTIGYFATVFSGQTFQRNSFLGLEKV